MKKLIFLLLGILAVVFFFRFGVRSATGPELDQQVEKEYAAEKSWPHVPYATVKAYLYNLDSREGSSVIPNPNIIENGLLVKSVTNREGIVLTPLQVQTLLTSTSLTPEHHDGITTLSLSACIFNPHYAFIFYDAKGTAFATIEVCTMCRDIEFSPDHVNHCRYNFKAIESLIEELGLPVFHDDADLDAYLKTR
jgi:hypothetical protein